MDYLIEAKKFVERAHEAAHPEVIKQHLKMAEWCCLRRSRSGTSRRQARCLANRTEARSCPTQTSEGRSGRGQLL